MNLIVSMLVYLPAILAALGICAWVVVDSRRYNAEPEPAKPAAIESWLVPEAGPVWAQSYPVETPTAEIPIVSDWGWAR